jgi:hypothetical protein
MSFWNVEIGVIFWKYLPKNNNNKSYYFIKVYVKILAKNVIFKKIQIHLQVFLKASVTMFNECFC